MVLPTSASMCDVGHMDADLELQGDVWLPEQGQHRGRETADGWTDVGFHLGRREWFRTKVMTVQPFECTKIHWKVNG